MEADLKLQIRDITHRLQNNCRYYTPALIMAGWKTGGKSKIFGKEPTRTLKDEKYNIWNVSLVGKFNRLDTRKPRSRKVDLMKLSRNRSGDKEKDHVGS